MQKEREVEADAAFDTWTDEDEALASRHDEIVEEQKQAKAEAKKRLVGVKEKIEKARNWRERVTSLN